MGERYFIGTSHQSMELEQLLERGKIDEKVFQVVIKQSKHIQRFTWYLLKNDISFERKPLGSGITNFFVDRTMPFFMAKKETT